MATLERTRAVAPTTSSAVQQATALLRRPLPQSDPGTLQIDGPGPWVALEREFIDVLGVMAAERAAAEHVIASASTRREELLERTDTDDEILAITSQLDRSSLAIERIDRLAPDVGRRLGEIRFHLRNAKWIEARDAHADEVAEFVDAIKTYEKARAKWAKFWNGITTDWPDAEQIVPFMPALKSSSSHYSKQLEKFRQLVFVLKPPGPSPLAWSGTLADAIAYAKEHGVAPAWAGFSFSQEIEDALAGEIWVETTALSLDAEGRTIPKGARLALKCAEAEKMILSGKARRA